MINPSLAFELKLMNKTHKLLTGCILISSLTTLTMAQITVDFNDEGTTLTESGFTGFDTADAGTATAIGNGISLTMNSFGNNGGRDRGTAGLTAAADFFRDGITGNDNGGKEIDFAFSGLMADSDYELTFWAWDNTFNNDDVTAQIMNTTDGGSTLSGSIDLTGTAPTSLSELQTTFTITSSASGTISLDFFGVQTSDTAISRGLMVNGFEITAIPEPTTFAWLVALSTFGLVVNRRKR